MLPYDHDRAAAFYVAKYITKEPLGWDLGGTWAPVDVPPVDGNAPVIDVASPAPSQPIEGHDASPDGLLHPCRQRTE